MYLKIIRKSIPLLKRGLLAIVVRDLFSIGVKIAITLLAARNLNSTDFAIFLLLSMLSGYAEALFRFKTDLSVGYFIGKKKMDQSEVISAQNTLILVAVLITFIFLVLFKQRIVDFLNIDEQYSLYVVGYLFIYSSAMQFFSAFVYLHLFHENFKLYREMVLISSTCYLVGVLLFINHLTIFNILGAQIIGIIATIIYSFLKSNYVPSIQFSKNYTVIRAMVVHSMKLYALNGVGMLQINLMLTLSGIYLSPLLTGHLGLLRQIFQVAERIPTFFTAIFFGTIMRDQPDNKKLTILITVSVALISFMCLCLIYVVLGQINIIFFLDKFPKLSDYFLILAPSILLSCTVSPMIEFLNSENHIMLSVKNISLSLIISLAYAFWVDSEANVQWLGSVYFIQASVMLSLTLWDFYNVEEQNY